MDSLTRVAKTATALVKADASFREAVRAAAEGGASYREIAEASVGLVSHEGARKIAKVRPIRPNPPRRISSLRRPRGDSRL